MFKKIIKSVTKPVGQVLKPVGQVTKPVGQVVQKITPWNDKTEGLFGIGKLTPWNDKGDNVAGNLLTGLTLAAAIAGGMHLANASSTASTTAAAAATTPQKFALTYTPQQAGYSLGSSTIPSTAIFGSENLALSGLSSTGLSTMETLSTLANGATAGATAGAAASSASPSLWATLTSKPVLPFTIIGGASLTGGAIQGLGSYLAAKENAKTQKEALALQSEQFDRQHTYSFNGVAEYLLRNMNKPTIRTAITTSQDAYLKMISDPAYRQGFITAAAKFTHPDVASQINDFINTNSSQARLYTV